MGGRNVPLGSKGPDQKYSCNGFLHLVQHSVEMRTGNWEVSGALG